MAGASAEWVIVSNGPSIKALSNSDLPSGLPTVAINHAISHPRLSFQYWCAMEEADRISNEIILNASPVVSVWVSKNTAWTWERKNLNIRVEAGKSQLPLEVFPYDNKKLSNLAGFWDGGNTGKPAPWGTRSVFAAMAIAISKGARKLHIFGVDMKGAHNFGGVRTGNEDRAYADRHSERNQRLWADRWHLERKLWKECVEAAHGIDIIRY